MKFLKQQLESDLSKEHAQQESDTSLPAHPGSEAALAGPAPPTSEHKQMPQSEKEGSAEIEFAQSLAASSVKKPFAFALKNPVNMCHQTVFLILLVTCIYFISQQTHSHIGAYWHCN